MPALLDFGRSHCSLGARPAWSPSAALLPLDSLRSFTRSFSLCPPPLCRARETERERERQREKAPVARMHTHRAAEREGGRQRGRQREGERERKRQSRTRMHTRMRTHTHTHTRRQRCGEREREGGRERKTTCTQIGTNTYCRYRKLPQSYRLSSLSSLHRHACTKRPKKEVPRLPRLGGGSSLPRPWPGTGLTRLCGRV